MTQPGDRTPLLQRPLYVFDLPEELLYTLQLKLQTDLGSPSPSSRPPHVSTSPSSLEPGRQDASPVPATSCALCGIVSATIQEQRSHVRSDLHGYNLKQKMRGQKPVTEADFERLVADLDESISGSDTSESDESDDPDGRTHGSKARDTTLSALLKRQAKVTDGDAEDAPLTKRKRGAGKPPLLWFASSKLPEDTSLGIYRAIFSDAAQEQEDGLVETIQRKQLAPKPPLAQQKSQRQEDDGGVPLPASMISNGASATGPHYFLCMIGGGHFAAMLVSLTPKLSKKGGMEDRSATVIAHKTFHRYTTRRKQGGSQSANDNAKGNAHSAGSSIRRHNEAALTQEVRDLLASWRPLIDSAELLFVRATGSTNRRTLFGPYEGQVLSTKDARLRGFPFSTRRATQSELMRAFIELTRVKVSTIDETAAALQAEAAAAGKADATSTSKPSTPKPPKASKADEEASLHTTQLQALIRRSKAPAMLSYLQSHSLPPHFPFFPPDQNRHAPTPLHLAASSNSPACVSSLLLKAGADPTLRNADSRSPFEIAGDRPTRDAFRLARSQLGEARWDWDAGAVPAALSEDEMSARAERERQEKAAEQEAETRRRRAETERLRGEDAHRLAAEREKAFGKGRVVTAKPPMTAEERRKEESKGMTEEMRMRLEREKRARAAEERMKRLQGGG